MDIHRKLRDLKQRPNVRVLKQWADGRVRQMRVLAHMTKLRDLKQRAPTGRAGASTAGSSTAAKIAAPGTAGERPLPRPIQAAATSLTAEL